VSLRISAGFLKGRVLTAPEGGFYRPLTGRFKQTLFNVLAEGIVDKTVLDLYAGIGTFGLEALSRGAARVTFVERDPVLLTALETNLRAFGLADAARVYGEDVLGYLEVVRPSIPYDIVFLDPPYGLGLAFRTVESLDNWPGFGRDTIGVSKTFKKERFAGTSDLELVEERVVGDDNLTIFARPRV